MIQYKIDTKKFSELKGLIEIPKFQRGLVWDPEKKKEFIKTLKEGLPIGILLLSRKDDKYLIIDGLQRFTTMLDYDRNYFKYIDREEITDTDLYSIIISSETSRDIYDGYTDFAKCDNQSQMTEIIVQGFQNKQNKDLNELSTEVTENLCKYIAMFDIRDFIAIQRCVYKLLERIESNAQIIDVEIPLIIFNGKEEKLADIFQKLNQEGVRLTKYDVFAATWINHIVTVKDDVPFINLITAKYDSAEEESGLEISNYDPDEMKKSGELTVFEYAFALGKALMNKCNKLFKKVDEKKVDSIGFVILAEILGLTYQNMGDLAKRISEYDKIDYKKLKDEIINAAVTVEKALDKYIIAPSKNASLACHSELQLASYIIVIFKLKHSISKEEGLKTNTGKLQELRDVKTYLYRHYLYDILRDYWAGAGDTKLEDIIRDPLTCRYTRDVDRDSFEQVMLNWLEESNQKHMQNSVPAQYKLFWNYYLRESNYDISKGKFDIEHCVPQKVLKNYFIAKDIEVPVSSVCNLCYIDMSDNRGKGEKTYYKKQDEYSGAFQLNEAELDKLLYPSRNDLEFVNSTETLTKERYMKFLDDRKSIIARRMMDVMYK